MSFLMFLIGAAIGVAATFVLLQRRRAIPTDASTTDEAELKTLLEEVRSLRQDIDILKVNPAIGQAVRSTLDFAHDVTVYDKSAYAVAVRPTPDLEKLAAYNVLVRPGPDRGEEDPRI